MKKSSLVSISALAISAFLFSGCKSGSNDAAMRAAWHVGDLDGASAELKKSTEADALEDATDPALCLLNAGLVHGLTGEYELSDRFFADADERLKEAYQQGEEKSLIALVSGSFSDEYELSAQETIMLPVLQTYALLGGNNKSAATSAASAIDNVSRAVQEAQRKRILARRAEAEKPVALSIPGSNGKAMEGSQCSISLAEEAKTAIDWKEIYGDDVDIESEFARSEAESLFVNPFAYWLSGAMTLYRAEDINSVGEAEKLFEEAVKVTGEQSPFLVSELKFAHELGTANSITTAENSALFKEWENSTYVIYEGGAAPAIGCRETTVKVPAALIVVANTLVAGIGQLGATGLVVPAEGTAYFPVVASHGSVPAISANGQSLEVLVDYDRVLEETLREDAETFASAAVLGVSFEYVKRAGALIGAGLLLRVAEEKNDQFLKMGAVAAFSAAVAYAASPIKLSRPDPRRWALLPRTLEVAKLKTPADGMIDISGEKVSVPAKGVNFLRIRKVDKYWPATVQVFPLDENAQGDVPVLRLPAPARPTAPAPATR